MAGQGFVGIVLLIIAFFSFWGGRIYEREYGWEKKNGKFYVIENLRGNEKFAVNLVDAFISATNQEFKKIVKTLPSEYDAMKQGWFSFQYAYAVNKETKQPAILICVPYTCDAEDSDLVTFIDVNKLTQATVVKEAKKAAIKLDDYFYRYSKP